jgi:hypothetical protein
MIAGGIIGAGTAGAVTGWLWWWMLAGGLVGGLAAPLWLVAWRWLIAGLMSKPYRP